MRPLPKYLPDDQHKHLGDMPWKQSDVVDAWIAAHNHDPRTKCLVEYGCQALEDHYEWLVEAYERDSEAWAQTSDPANVTDHIDVLRRNVAAACWRVIVSWAKAARTTSCARFIRICAAYAGSMDWRSRL